MKTGILTLWMLVMVAGIASAEERPGLPTADEIVRKANHMALYQGADSKGRVTLVITDKQGRSRTRQFNILRKNIGDNDRDQYFYAFFQSPADVRRMVFMVHKHAGAENDDDRWLYLPALDLVKRIAAGDKRTSFVGSDFLYEDISGRGVDEDLHELLRSTETHYIVKNTPRKKGEVEFAYYLAHIDRQTLLPVRLEYFKPGDRLYRVIEATRVEPVAAEEEGRKVLYSTVVRSLARNLETGGRTEMSYADIRYNLGLDESLFSERYLRRPPRTVLR